MTWTQLRKLVLIENPECPAGDVLTFMYTHFPNAIIATWLEGSFIEKFKHYAQDRLVSLLLMKMIVCWASATYFQFHSRQFVRRLAEEILSYSSVVMFVALALSYLTITCHIAYKTSIIKKIVRRKISIWNSGSTTRWIYTCPVSSGMGPRPPPEVVWAIDSYPSRMCFGGHFYTWSFQDLIAIWSEKKTH